MNPHVIPGVALTSPVSFGLSLTPEPWVAEALCQETDPDAFFPPKGGSTAAAKRVCAACPVQGECLEFALRTDQRFGIYGGLSERQRRLLKKARP